MQIIKNELFQEWITTQEHIERLSNPNNEVSPIEAANLVVKFAIDYIVCSYPRIWWYSQPLELDFTKSILEKATDVLSTSDNKLISIILSMWKKENSKIQKNIEQVSYQLLMLLDFPKTTALVLDIINREIPKNKNWYVWIDLWTWTWILLLAQYIQAKRNWFLDREITNIWIEKNQDAVKIWKKLAENLWFWKIINWDTTSNELIESLWVSHINFLSNENLPSPSASLKQEPFVENLLALRKTWFELWSIDWMLPEIVYYTSKIWWESTRVKIKDKAQFYEFLEMYIDPKLRLKIRYINLWWKKIHLSDIWKSELWEKGIFTGKSKCVNRW